jgi:hypothetical protein
MRRFLARELAKKDTSLVGFWPLQGNTLDYSGRGTHVRPIQWLGTSGATPEVGLPIFAHMHNRGGALLRNYASGSDTVYTYLQCDNTVDVNFEWTQPFSISAWIKPIYVTSLNPTGPDYFQQNIVAKVWYMDSANAGSTHWQGYLFSLKQQSPLTTNANWVLDFRLFTYDSGMSLTTIGGNAIISRAVGYPMEWWHVVVTWDGSGKHSGIKLYANGKPLDVTTYASPSRNLGANDTMKNSNKPLLIGGAEYQNNSAIISLVRLYRRKLSLPDVCKMYFNELDAVYNRKQVVAKIPFVHNYIPLYISSSITDSGNIPLFIQGSQPIATGIPLYMNGITLREAGLNLTTKGNSFPSTSNTIPLHINGIASGINGSVGSIPLYISGLAYGKGLNLFLQGAMVGQTTRNLNLYIKGKNPSIDGGIPLFLRNTAVPKTIPLYIYGTGYYSGEGILRGASLNLYLARAPGAMIPLYINAPSNIEQSIPLYIKGVQSVTSGIPLSIPSTFARPSGVLPMYTIGY